MLQKVTLSFLSELATHNNKPWFDAHKTTYIAAKEDFSAWIELLLHHLAGIDPAFGNVSAKDCIFRIYRDQRFNKGQPPYKTHFAAGISELGKNGRIPGYYIHIAPGNKSFIGGGIWRPDALSLAKIRQEIDYETEGFLKIILAPSFKQQLGVLAEGDSLLRPPKGYSKDHPAVHYLKMKNFLATRNISDQIVTTDRLMEDVLRSIYTMQPLMTFLSTALS